MMRGKSVKMKNCRIASTKSVEKRKKLETFSNVSNRLKRIKKIP